MSTRGVGDAPESPASLAVIGESFFRSTHTNVTPPCNFPFVTTMSESLHGKPPAWMKDTYKTYQKLGKASLDQRADLIDLNRTDEDINQHLDPSKVTRLPAELRKTFEAFLGSGGSNDLNSIPFVPPKAFEVTYVPGEPS